MLQYETFVFSPFQLTGTFLTIFGRAGVGGNPINTDICAHFSPPHRGQTAEDCSGERGLQTSQLERSHS